MATERTISSLALGVKNKFHEMLALDVTGDPVIGRKGTR